MFGRHYPYPTTIHHHHHYLHLVGLIPITGVREEYPLVKAKCHYDIEDVYTIATLVQEYFSDAPVDRDVNYSFPLPPDAAVCSFKAVIDDKKVIEGIVKEKEEAKREFKEAVAAGKQAGLLEQAHADIFKISLGNIKPKQKVAVHISFVSIIPHDASSPTTLRLTMPTTIAPRYGAAPQGVHRPNRANEFDLTVAVHMTQPVTSVSSPTHNIALQLGTSTRELVGDFQPSKAFISLNSSSMLDKDIVVVIASQKLDVPRCVVERIQGQETTDAIAFTLVPKFDLPALPAQDYIFLVDRSGSMSGTRITQVRTALQIMLKSLPSRNTTFNIVSFGSHHDSLWSTSVGYNSENVAQASSYVDRMEANYGGTEIKSALSYAFQMRHQGLHAGQRIPSTVFVLTDGEAWDLDNVIKTVSDSVAQAKSEKNLLRVFVLGVGDDVSKAMCDSIARAGRGAAVYVGNNEKPDAKLMSLLRASRGGVIDDLTISWGEPEYSKASKEDDDFEIIGEDTASIITVVEKPKAPAPISLFGDDPKPAEAPNLGPQKAIVNLGPPPRVQQSPKTDKLPIPLYPGFRCSIFAIIRQSSIHVPFPEAVTISGNVLGNPVQLSVPITQVQLSTSTPKGVHLIHTLAAKALVQEFEDQPKTAERDAQIERLGKRYSIATSVTSFLAVDKETDKIVESAKADASVEEGVEERIEKESAGIGGTFLQSKSHSTKLVTVLGGGGRGGGFGAGLLSSFDSRKKAAPVPTAAAAPATGYSPIAHSAPTGGYQISGAPMQLQQQQVKYSMSPGASVGGLFGSASVASAAPSFGAYAPPQTASFSSGAAPGFGAYASPQVSSLASIPSPPTFARDRDRKTFGATTMGLSSQPTGFYPQNSAPPPPPPSFAPPAPSMGLKPSSHASSFVPQSVPGVSSGSQGGPLSVEFVARAQNFDGSFPTTANFLKTIIGTSQAPNQPLSLQGINGPDDVKDSIWITILTLAVLEKKFGNGDERSTWEMLAEKAVEFIEGVLVDSLGLNSQESTQLISQWKSGALSFV